MAFKPLDEREVHDELLTRDDAYRLAVLVCGGMGIHTDRVADRIRKGLPGFLVSQVETYKKTVRQSVMVEFRPGGSTYPYRNPDDALIGDRVAVSSPCADDWDDDSGEGPAFGRVVDFALGCPNPTKVCRKVPRN